VALDVYVHTTLWILCVQSIYDAQAALSEFHIYKRRGWGLGGGGVGKGWGLKIPKLNYTQQFAYGHYLYALYTGGCTLSFNVIDLARTPAEEPRSRRPIPAPNTPSVLAGSGSALGVAARNGQPGRHLGYEPRRSRQSAVPGIRGGIVHGTDQQPLPGGRSWLVADKTFKAIESETFVHT